MLSPIIIIIRILLLFIIYAAVDQVDVVCLHRRSNRRRLFRSGRRDLGGQRQERHPVRLPELDVRPAGSQQRPGNGRFRQLPGQIRAERRMADQYGQEDEEPSVVHRQTRRTDRLPGRAVRRRFGEKRSLLLLFRQLAQPKTMTGFPISARL